MNKFASLSLLIASLSQQAVAEEEPYSADALLPTVSGVIGAANRGDIIWAKSALPPNLIKGSFGESIASRSVVQGKVAGQAWKPIAPRSSPQGLDHLFIQTNPDGTIADILVGESKYGSSRLGISQSGVQLGKGWSNRRIHALGSRYLDVAKAAECQFGQLPLAPKQQVSIYLKNGKDVSFWKSDGKWHFSGTDKELNEAQALANHYGETLRNAGKGLTPYKRYLFHSYPSGSDMKIDIYDATGTTEPKGLKSLKYLDTIPCKGLLAQDGRIPLSATNDVAKAIRKSFGGIMPESEARSLAREIIQGTPARELLSPFSAACGFASVGAKAGLIGAGADLLFQSLTGNGINWEQTAYSASIVATGSLAGCGAQILARNSTGMVRSVFGSFAGSSMYSGLIGGGGALTVAFVLYDTIEAIRGNMSFSDYSRNLSITSSGLAAGGLVYSAVAAYGTASTGTAISTLSGIAAQNATLAALGGGAQAAGGAGVVAGGAVLAGVAVIAAAAVYIGFRMYDSHQENKRIQLKFEWMDAPTYNWEYSPLYKAWKNY